MRSAINVSYFLFFNQIVCLLNQIAKNSESHQYRNGITHYIRETDHVMFELIVDGTEIATKSNRHLILPITGRY